MMVIEEGIMQCKACKRYIHEDFLKYTDGLCKCGEVLLNDK